MSARGRIFCLMSARGRTFFVRVYGEEYMNIALHRFLHNHGNIATEGSPKPGLRPTLISNDSKGSL